MRDQQFTALALDAVSINWIEAVGNPDPHATLGIYDLARSSVSRTRTALSSVYQIVPTSDRLFFATGFGVMETDRVASYEPKKFAPEGSAVDQLAVLGPYLLYRSFDPEQTVAALDLISKAHAVLARNATNGPLRSGNWVLWSERAAAGNPGRVGIVGSN